MIFFRTPFYSVTLVALLAIPAMANPSNTGGQSGVSRTLSTYSLGKGSINTGLGFKADYAYHGIYLYNQDGSVEKQSPTLLSEDLYFGYGITNWFDASIDLPVYQDIWEDHSENASGLGDLSIGFKLQHPGLYQEAPFRVAYYMRMVLPTGTDDAGYFQRHSYQTQSTTNTNGAFTMDGFALNPMMLWSLDLAKFPFKLPLTLHANFGGIAQVQQGQRRHHSALLGSFAAEYQVKPSVSVFGEISGEAKLVEFAESYNFTTDLNNDVIRFALGTNIKCKNGINTSVSVDVGLSEKTNSRRLNWERENDDGDESRYTTVKTPRVGLNLQVGYAKRGKNAGHVLGRFFAPEDTILVVKYDTLKVLSHDTVKIVQNDTIRVQVRDTVVIIKNDTIKVVQTIDPNQALQRGILAFPSINFVTGSAELTQASYATLNDIAQSMLTFTTVKIEVRGYTDATGTVEVNKKLSQARAESVTKYLTSKGVPALRLTPIGLGASAPIADNSSVEGRTLNRRVELKRFDK